MKQQPGWKEVYEKMPANDKVAFAEVNCRESRELMQKHKVLLIFLDFFSFPADILTHTLMHTGRSRRLADTEVF
jgi:hypothetical protein